jgi:spore maturation protein B
MLGEYLIIAYFLLVIIYGIIKKTNCLEAFTNGVREGTITILNMFSYLLGFVLLVRLLESCGLIEDLQRHFLPASFSPLIFVQALMRPFSTGSSYALMLEVYQTCGADSFSGVLSTFIHTVSDASVYIIGFFFAAVGIKKYPRALWIGVLLNILGFILAILAVRFLIF